MVAAGWMWGKPAFYYGSLKDEMKIDRIERNCPLMRGAVARGVSERARAGASGDRPRREGSDVRHWFRWEIPQGHRKCRAQDCRAGEGFHFDGDEERNDAAGRRGWCGHRVRTRRRGLEREGRWSTFAPDRLGGRISISTDAGRLWVSDTERHRVLVFDISSGKLLASFGAADKPGDDLQSLSSPR